MKTLVALFLSLFATTVFANSANQTATSAELNYLCRSVDKQLAEWKADMALYTASCESAQAQTSQCSKGLKIVSGQLTFNAPNRPSFQLDCQAAYIGEANSVVSFGILCE